MKTSWTELQSPFGRLKVISQDDVLVRLAFEHEFDQLEEQYDLKEDADPEAFTQFLQELKEYFAGERKAFSVPYKLQGTNFQKQCWDFLAKIPYGQKRSYGDEAKALGGMRYSRAVGQANGKNPLPIVVPCHRVVSSSGSLGGYSGGISKKQWLLEREATAQ